MKILLFIGVLQGLAVLPVAVLRGASCFCLARSFLLNFTFKFVWLTYTADNFQLAKFLTNWKLSGDGSDDIHKPMLDLIGLIIANQPSLQRKITMLERHLCWPPHFFLGPAVPPSFFILESPLGLASLRVFFRWKIEHQVRKACYWGTWLGAREMLAICMKVVTSSSVASPKVWGRPNSLTLSEKRYFVRDTACRSTKWQDVLRIWGAWPLYPWPCLWLQEKNGKERSALTWCSTFLWQKARNDTRPPDTAELRWKAILSVLDATFGCSHKQRFLVEALHVSWIS